MSGDKSGTEGHGVELATVQIRVLSINGKKMPVSIYEQLADERPWGADGRPLGKFLGWVNRHSGCPWAEGAHLHLVWDRGGQLRRHLEVNHDQGADLITIGSGIAIARGKFAERARQVSGGRETSLAYAQRLAKEDLTGRENPGSLYAWASQMLPVLNELENAFTAELADQAIRELQAAAKRRRELQAKNWAELVGYGQLFVGA